MIENSKGTIFYGLHMYPGVAEYEDAKDGAFRVFINESTIRKMNPTFAGRPLFVEHVDAVEENLKDLRGEADGWVIESFFNEADGKTWAKFIVVSERGLQAIKQGFRLSNAYIPKSFANGGLWNGVSYRNEVTSGEFEHLAIVKHPRYEESVIMTPDEFKAYNGQMKVELERLANSKNKKGDSKMAFNIFKRTKVENSTDLEGMIVALPKSKKEVSITTALTEYDAILNMHGYANGDHLVKVGEKDEMSVNDLVKKHLDMCNEMDKMKAKNAETEDGGEPGKGADDDKDPATENSEESIDEDSKAVDDRGGDKHLANEEEEEEKPKDKEKMKNEAKAKALRVKNAKAQYEQEEVAIVSLPQDQVARGRALYGSN